MKIFVGGSELSGIHEETPILPLAKSLESIGCALLWCPEGLRIVRKPESKRKPVGKPCTKTLEEWETGSETMPARAQRLFNPDGEKILRNMLTLTGRKY